MSGAVVVVEVKEGSGRRGEPSVRAECIHRARQTDAKTAKENPRSLAGLGPRLLHDGLFSRRTADCVKERGEEFHVLHDLVVFPRFDTGEPRLPCLKAVQVDPVEQQF